MKYLILALTLTACAHSQSKEQHRRMVAERAWERVEKIINSNAIGYGNLIKGSRFLRLVDIEMTKDAEAGVIVVNALGEDHEFLGRIFVYVFCDPNGVCTTAQVAIKSVEEQKQNAPTNTDESM
jgi:hypothetical protein